MTNFDSSTSLKKYADQDFIYFVMSEKSSIVRCKQLPLYKDVSALECMYLHYTIYIYLRACMYIPAYYGSNPFFFSENREKVFYHTYTHVHVYM